MADLVGTRLTPVRQGLSQSRLANLAAQTIRAAFETYQDAFGTITRRARARFESRDWHGLAADAAERLDLYGQVVDPTVLEVRRLLGAHVEDRLVWAALKAVYSGAIAQRDDWEIAETFFNSITRRIFTTVGVDPAIEFVDTDFDYPPTPPTRRAYRVYAEPVSPAVLLEVILDDFRHAAPYVDRDGDVRLAARVVSAHLAGLGLRPVVERAEVLTRVFYRNKGAYLVGRLWSGGQLVPLAIALVNTPTGVAVDAILLDENDLSMVFSFARSYFHVEVERPYEVVAFLRSVMPRKRVAELYISLGYHKHGKTELYRDLLHCLEVSDERFEVAPGEQGMVMEVFTLPHYDLVLKVIKDRFAEPKQTTRRAVMEKYRLVFRHDRAGRLVDAQEFEHLEFARERFSDALLGRLLETSAGTVGTDGDRVHLRHAYVERRVTPLDIYLRTAPMEAARAAAVEYGHAIKDLAASNIFPGDFWLKNFGVTRHGRVVFYDYDELCLLTECRFAAMPESRDDLEEMSSEPWFYVGVDDVFPEEFRTFLRMPRGLNDAFVEQHGELFTVDWWEQMQARLRAGEMLDIYPYAQSRRLRATV